MRMVLGLLLEGGEDAAHGLFDAGVRLKRVGDIDEGYVDARAVGEGIVLMEQSVRFAYASAHGHAVYGMM